MVTARTTRLVLAAAAVLLGLAVLARLALTTARAARLLGLAGLALAALRAVAARLQLARAALGLARATRAVAAAAADGVLREVQGHSVGRHLYIRA